MSPELLPRIRKLWHWEVKTPAKVTSLARQDLNSGLYDSKTFILVALVTVNSLHSEMLRVFVLSKASYPGDK